MLLVSGLGLGGGGGESLLGTQLLVDVVTGQLGDEGEQCSAAHVSRVILAGNLLSHSTQSRDSINKVAYTRPQPLLPPLGTGSGSSRGQCQWRCQDHLCSGSILAQPLPLSPAGGICSAPSTGPQVERGDL